MDESEDLPCEECLADDEQLCDHCESEEVKYK